MSSGMDMSDFLGVFLEEAQEQFQKLDDGILQLEKEPENIEVLKEIFRAAHTLKSSSATMGFKDMADLTHVMENLLDILRNGKRKTSSNDIDYLLEGIDILRIFVNQISEGKSLQADTQELIKNLKEASGVKSEPNIAKADNKKLESLNNTITTGLQPGRFKIIAKTYDVCLMPSVRAFMLINSLKGLGEVTNSDPSAEQIDDCTQGQVIRIDFDSTVSSDEIIKVISELSEIELLSISTECVKDNMSFLEAQNKLETNKITVEEGNLSVSSKTAKTIQTVRIGVDYLDSLMNLVAELVIDKTRICQIESELSNKYETEELVYGLGETAAHIGRVVNELQEHIMKVRLLPVEQVFSRFPRMVRDLAHKAGKDIEFELQGQETELDRSILEEIVDPITHLLRNAVDHGTELPDVRELAGKPRKAKIILAAKQEENRVIIEVSDSGNGIDLESVKRAALKNGQTSQELLSRMSDEDALQLIFASGVTTAEKITDLSGRGVGMDVVRNNIQKLSGNVEVNSVEGKGTTFRISLPLTLAIIQALVTKVSERVYIIPLSAVVETVRCSSDEIKSIDGHPAINFRGSVLPLVHLGELFEPNKKHIKQSDEYQTFVIVNLGASKVGFIVDKLIGEQEIVMKPLGSFFGDLQGIGGATILGDGKVALIVDIAGIGHIFNRRRYDRAKLGIREAA